MQSLLEMLKRQTDIFAESTVKLTKIFDLVNFKDIESLPARELAYTANLASRGGGTNEGFWSRMKNAFVENDHMNGKYTSQVFLALDKANFNDSKLTALCLSRVTRNIESFGAMDLILILHAIAKKHIELEGLEIIGSRLASLPLVLSPQLTAVLFAAVAKLGIHNDKLTNHLVSLSKTHLEEFNQFELAAVLRAVNPHTEFRNELLNSIVWSEVSDSNTFSIILHACTRNEIRDDVRASIFKNLQPHLSNADLRPYLFLHAVQLAKTEDQTRFCVGIGTGLLRNFKQLKALSMPVVLEGLKNLQDTPDTRILLSEGTRLAESVIDRFLLMTSREDRLKLLESKQAKIYSSWFHEKLLATLEPEGSGKIDISATDRIRAYIKGSIGLAEVGRVDESNVSDESLMQFLWVVSTRESKFFQKDLFHTIMTKFSENPETVRTDQFYSLLFRFLLPNTHFVHLLRPLLEQVDPSVCLHKTLCRYLQLPLVSKSKILSAVVERLDEARTEDLLGILPLLKDIDPALVEAKMVRKLGQVKSLEARMRIVKRGELFGFDLTEIVDEMEQEMMNASSTVLE